jgi:hypothetical protein
MVEDAGTVTLAGTVAAAGIVLDRFTVKPLATPLNVTVTVELAEPPVTVLGFRETDVITGGVTVSDAETVTPAKEADIETGVAAATGLVLMVKLALVVPCATNTRAGAVPIATLPVDSATHTPPLGAGMFNVTVPVTADPPRTLFGFNVRPCSGGAEALLRNSTSVQ